MLLLSSLRRTAVILLLWPRLPLTLLLLLLLVRSLPLLVLLLSGL